MSNTGQTCGAVTRTLVPRDELDDYLAAFKDGVEAKAIGDPRREDVAMGPLVSEEQWNTVQRYIRSGIGSGAWLMNGGLGKPEGLDAGHFTKPTIFADVTNDMPVAREEIFGPVMSVIAYDDVEEAIAIANDSPYGLAGVINGTDGELAHDVARRLRIGFVVINDPPFDPAAPWVDTRHPETGESGFGRNRRIPGDQSDHLRSRLKPMCYPITMLPARGSSYDTDLGSGASGQGSACGSPPRALVDFRLSELCRQPFDLPMTARPRVVMRSHQDLMGHFVDCLSCTLLTP